MMVISPPDIPASIFNVIAQQNMDAESTSGIKAFATGGGITGAGLGNTAAGVNMTMSAASKREFGILRRLAEGVKAVGRKFIAMNAINLSEEEVVRVTNSTFQKIRREDLAGNFDLSISISTKEADEAKTQKLAMMLQTIGNTMDFSLTKMILGEIARLQSSPELSQAILSYEPTPDPIQEKLKELEVQKVQAEIEEIMSRVADNHASSQYKAAKVPNEQIKAEKTFVDVEHKKLDIQEQVQGISHNRKMEELQASSSVSTYNKALDIAAKRDMQNSKNQVEIAKEIMRQADKKRETL
jgi:hypothetical protein